MKHALPCVLCALSLLGYAAPAFSDDAITPESIELRVSRPGDLEMTCAQLSQEALLMKDIITTTQNIKDNSDMQQHGITAAGAVGSFLVGTVTGGVGLAAAGMLLDYNVEEKADGADSVQDVAEQRRSLMLGIHNAKSCYGPMENAMQDPEPASLMEIAAVEPAGGNAAGPRTKPRYNQ